MSQKKNTSAITGKIIRKAALTGMIPGGVLGALLTLLGLSYGYAANLVPIFVTALCLFAVCVIVAVFLGWLKANRFRSAVSAQEKGGVGSFDAEVMRPITTDGTAWISDNWILLSHDGQYIPLNRAHIVSCDGVNERREGMKKLWLGIVTDKGERPAVLYAACEPDALAVVNRWLGNAAVQAENDPFGFRSAESTSPSVPPMTSASAQPAAAPVIPPASPAPVPPSEPPAAAVKNAGPAVKKIPTGTCPFCFGPNDPAAEFCQWCGSKLN